MIAETIAGFVRLAAEVLDRSTQCIKYTRRGLIIPLSRIDIDIRL